MKEDRSCEEINVCAHNIYYLSLRETMETPWCIHSAVNLCILDVCYVRSSLPLADGIARYSDAIVGIWPSAALPAVRPRLVVLQDAGARASSHMSVLSLHELAIC